MATSYSLPPSTIVIFGITGDLSKRYLLPALSGLIQAGLLHEKTVILGISRQDISAADVLRNLDVTTRQVLESRLEMVRLDLTAAADYAKLRQHLDELEDRQAVCMNRLYYLSIPPQVYGAVTKLMGQAGLQESCQHGTADARLLVEKPFGYDLASARELIETTAQVFKEEQVFRIDHYLAKETVQNILAFRFQNAIFEAVWSNRYISSIEISASEKVGLEGRHFYDNVGALRDFIQSHLLQLLAIVTMDQPAELTSDAIHNEKQMLLKQVETVNCAAQAMGRGQYDGYRQEVSNPTSTTETFAGIRVHIDTPRWQQTPIVLWTGKNLVERKTEISVNFAAGEQGKVNRLRFRIQPNEGIELELVTKKPGFDSALQTVVMDFSYDQNFGSQQHSNAYARVLADAIRGDHTLFATSTEVMEAWRIVEPVLQAWQNDQSDLVNYAPGATGETLAHPLNP